MSARRLLTVVLLVGLLCGVAGLLSDRALHAGGEAASPEAPGEEKQAGEATVSVVSIPDEERASSGKPFKRWMRRRGWSSEFGSPEYFYVRDGALHMVSKPGPVYNDRYSLAVFNRQKLIEGMENKVLLRVAGEPELRLDPGTYPYIRFRMTPLKLPAEGADLRNASKNDAAFYLLVGFDTKRHEFEGRKMPETVAYVWANREWDAPVGSDPDYSSFLRYIPIGHNGQGLGEPHTILRNVRKDYLLAFPERRGKPVPDIIKVGLMIDSNTVGGNAESVLQWIRFQQEPTAAPEGEGDSEK